MKLSAVALFTLALGVPTSFLDPEDLESRAILDARTGNAPALNRGVNIIKSLGTAANGAFTGGKIVVVGAVRAAGSIRDVFVEDNRGEHIALAAYRHLQSSVALVHTTSVQVNAVLQHGEWKPSWGMFNGVSGATYTAAAALDTASGMVTQITANDFQLLCDTIQDYYTNIGVPANQFWAPSGDAFQGFPGLENKRRSEYSQTMATRDLQSQQLCAKPIDIRKYFSPDDAPQVSTTSVKC